MISALTAISPIDGRYSDKTEPLREIYSEYGLIHNRVKIEILWLIALSKDKEIKEVPKFSAKLVAKLHNIYMNFNQNDAKSIKKIEKVTNHDVKAIEYWLKNSLKNEKEIIKVSEFIHFACTSEDINNLAYALMLKESLNKVLIPSIESVLKQFYMFSTKFSEISMLAKTHGQTASPTTMGKEFANFGYRLKRQIVQLKDQEILGKINGAVGNFNAHISAYPKKNWQKFSKEFITTIGLTYNPYTTQIEPHDYMAEIFQNISRVNNILIDFNRDIWTYISNGYFKQKTIKNEVGSSTMPHKVNPIDFENSEGNLGLSNTLLNHFAMKLPISRLQRDLTDSTVLRNIGLAFSYSLIAYKSCSKGLTKLELNKIIISQDLSQSWEVLAEPIQTVMRKNKIKNPYEKLKDLTRGNQNINKESLHSFIKLLKLPKKDEDYLLKLTPQNYIGLATLLAKKFK
ncbi:adenylosuccinate lyase [Methylophilaceae bacterium]|jgi:adenylosuccinate lyase|nr:adenylosuccinate lyase [Methylophilaceae bacterium]|tara:strand:- start:24400 stop:25770 length:1371 start_codon:yes stop_codon:yes gene_type:complete